MTESDKALQFTAHPPFLLGNARIDPPGLCIGCDGKNQRVEAKVMQVLLALAREPGNVVSRSDLEKQVWSSRIVSDDAVTNAVAKLRKALNDNPRKPSVIETISKSGYRLKIAPEAEEPVPQKAPQLDPAALRPSRRLLLLGGFLLICVVAIIMTMDWRASKEPTKELPQDGKSASIAVIPFDVLDDDASQAYFAEGITLDLITELSRLPRLLVIAPGTMFGYRETAVDERAIASELGVQYLIRGGVQRIGEKIRINVRLLDTDSGHTLWAERFAGDTGNLFEIQDKVVTGIASALPVWLALSQQPLKRSGATNSIDAYDAFLRGQKRYGRRTPEDNRVARHHFERAIALDSNFARAHAGLGLVWSRLAIDGWTDDAADALSIALEHVDKATSIDPTVPQIHFVRAQVELFRGQHSRAAAAAMTAIDLDPNYADAYALLAWILHYAGRPDQAEPALREALKRNPSSSASYREIAGEIYFATGRYVKAVKEFEAALERNPAHMRARLWLAATLARLGHDEEAAWEAQELLAINPEFSLSRLLLAFPLKDPQQRKALTESLVRLGFPDEAQE